MLHRASSSLNTYTHTQRSLAPIPSGSDAGVCRRRTLWAMTCRFICFGPWSVCKCIWQTWPWPSALRPEHVTLHVTGGRLGCAACTQVLRVSSRGHPGPERLFDGDASECDCDLRVYSLHSLCCPASLVQHPTAAQPRGATFRPSTLSFETIHHSTPFLRAT